MADNKNNMQDEADIITLEFDDGTELECEIMGVLIIMERTTSL